MPETYKFFQVQFFVGVYEYFCYFLAMENKKIGYIIANFGGPRTIDEVEPFLRALLTDKDVIRTKLPMPLSYLLFAYIAKRRAKKVTEDYQTIGGGSPIYKDTEDVAEILRTHLPGPVITFHRYLHETHAEFINTIQNTLCDRFIVFPMFPQFTYATTGSIAKWFEKKLPESISQKMRWIKSYPNHPAFIEAHVQVIRHYLKANQLDDQETILLFSAHGIPKQFITTGDVYQDECESSFHAIMRNFPNILGRLAYQSRFGRAEWIQPYTIDVCKGILSWCQGRKNVAIIPISFTSDHIETLHEIESEYMPVIRDRGLNVYRIPALTLDPSWINAIIAIINEQRTCNNQMLIYRSQ